MIATPSGLFVVVSCMGRLTFLRQTAPRVLAHPAVRYCLVDYSCPDRCGDWLVENFPADAACGRVLVERVPGRTLFNKSAAQNAGAARAISERAEYLCILDADTLVSADFVSWVLENARRDRFLIAARQANGADRFSLTGVIVVHADAFQNSGGYDETFKGWGAEDIEFRMRLSVLHGLEYADIPLELLDAIPHGDDLRTQFYREKKNPSVSNYCNIRKLKYRIWNKWRARWKTNPDRLERLWYRP